RRRREALAEAARRGERVERERGVRHRDVLEKVVALIERAPHTLDGFGVGSRVMTGDRADCSRDVIWKVSGQRLGEQSRLLVAAEDEEREGRGIATDRR